MIIGNRVCKYAKKQYGINVSILIDKFDMRENLAKTYQEMIKVFYNPGFWDIYNKNTIKKEIEQLIDNNVEKLKRWPCFVKKSIFVQDEYFNISISGFENINGKFDCNVNNKCYSKENPFDELQGEINKKTKKSIII